MAASMTHATRTGIGTSAPTTKQIEFMRNTIAPVGEHLQNEGIRGTRSRIAESIVEGVIPVSGEIEMNPRPDELDTLLPLILGGGSNPTFTLAETLPTFVVDVDKIADVYRYAGMKVNTATFRSAKNSLLTLAMACEGLTETGGITFPSISATLSLLRPYVHHELVLTLDGSTFLADNIEIVINNGLILDRYFNSQTRTEIPEGDRIITLKVDVPYTSTEKTALYSVALAGIAGSAVWTKGNRSLGFAFAAMQKPTQAPIINARGQEVGMTLTFSCRKDATTPTNELIVTNDSTG